MTVRLTGGHLPSLGTPPVVTMNNAPLVEVVGTVVIPAGLGAQDFAPRL